MKQKEVAESLEKRPGTGKQFALKRRCIRD